MGIGLISIFTVLLVLNGKVFAQVSQGRRFWQGMIAEYQKIIDENPTSVEAHMNLGLAYLSLGAVDRAVESFENVRRIDEELRCRLLLF